MNRAEELTQWAAAPERTVDDLCALEILLETGERYWRSQNKQYSNDWEKERKQREERAGNPAYRPKIAPTSLKHTIEVAHLLKNFTVIWTDDRPLRSVGPFQFIEAIEHLGLRNSEIADLSPIRSLPNLRKLDLHEPMQDGGFVVENVDALADLPLTDLTLGIRIPWPDLRGLARLPQMTTFAFRGNLLSLRDVGMLPEAQSVTLEADLHWKTPLRDFRDLPAMPKVRSLRVDGIGSLDGAEAFTSLRSLNITGPFRDLSPLTKLTELTWIRLEGTIFMDLSPLAKLPKLREVVLVRERPLDLDPLSEAPALREVFVERCAILRTELAALNAALPPWGLDFALPNPRPLRPLRHFSYRPGDPDVVAARHAEPSDGRAEFYDGDEHYATAEGRWFGRELQRRLDDLLGQDWGDTASYSDKHPGHRHLTIQRFRDVIRMDEILQVCRELLATCRFRWCILVSAEPHGDLSQDMADIRAAREEQEKDWLDHEFDPEQEKEDYEDFQKMRRQLYERLEREHRLRLLEQQGEEINPADFSPSAAKAKKRAAESDDDESWEDEEEAFEEDEALSEFEEEMSFVFYLTEEGTFVADHMLETYESTLGVRAEDWHTLPEPPEKRPRPQ